MGATAKELGRLYDEEGATLDDVLNGEAERRWIEEACGGDAVLVRAVFLSSIPKRPSSTTPSAV